MTRIAAVILLLVSFAGCSARPATDMSSAQPSTGPTAPVVTTPPSPDPTLEPTPEPNPTVGLEPCPTSGALTPMTFWETPDRCFGSQDVRILGWLDTPAPFGYEAPEVKPNWLFYPPEGTLYFTLFESIPSDPEHICADCPGIFVHLAPDADIVLDGPARWVIATGHRNDPAAERCHYVATDDDIGELPDDESARVSCRANFVLVALENAAAPSP